MIDLSDPDIVAALECLSPNDGEYMDEPEIHVVTDDEEDEQSEASTVTIDMEEDEIQEQVFMTPTRYTRSYNTPPRSKKVYGMANTL